MQSENRLDPRVLISDQRTITFCQTVISASSHFPSLDQGLLTFCQAVISVFSNFAKLWSAPSHILPSGEQYKISFYQAVITFCQAVFVLITFCKAVFVLIWLWAQPAQSGCLSWERANRPWQHHCIQIMDCSNILSPATQPSSTIPAHKIGENKKQKSVRACCLGKNK